jgi:short-chain 2-methylacyl-CoA dehydrogenase
VTPRPVTWLSEEEQAWRGKCRSTAADVVGPYVAAMDKAARIDPEVLTGLRDAGLLAIEVPEAYGGAGRTLFDAVLAIEEVSRVDPAVAVLVDVQNMLAISALLRHGSGEQRRRLLPRLATGTVGAYALSEEQSGSDAFAVATLAVRDGDGYRLTGTKKWTSSAREAGLFVVFATVAGEGVTAFLVDRDAAGLSVGEPVDKLGVRASSTCELRLDGVAARDRDVLGGAGRGDALAVETLNIGKLGIAAQLVGLADAALAAATAYAAERSQFGRPIATYQGVAFPLAQLAAELDAARTVLYDTARLLEHGGTPGERLRYTAVAKLLASQVAERAAAQAVETLGGNGYTAAYGVEKLYRDAKVGKIYEGTSNMQYRTIAATGPRGGSAS